MPTYQDDDAKAPHQVMIAVGYTLFIIALTVFAARIFVRLKYSKQLFWDDAWACAAIVCLLAHTIVTHVMLPALYFTVTINNAAEAAKKSGEPQPPPPGPDDSEAQAQMASILSQIGGYIKLQFAATMLFWTCLWLVKASFLSFFKRLTTNVRGHQIAWWVIVVIVTLSYIGAAITYPVSCSKFEPGKFALVL